MRVNSDREYKVQKTPTDFSHPGLAYMLLIQSQNWLVYLGLWIKNLDQDFNMKPDMFKANI